MSYGCRGKCNVARIARRIIGMRAVLVDNSLITQLAKSPVCGYQAEADGATEPTALSALALAANGQPDAAREAADWLAVSQATDGSVSVRRNTDGPPVFGRRVCPCWLGMWLIGLRSPNGSTAPCNGCCPFAEKRKPGRAK